MMKCILHIGTEKTGTTTLQQWLYSNVINFSREGIFLSKMLGQPNNRLLASFFQETYDDWFLVKNIRTSEEKTAYFKNFGTDFGNEIELASKSHHTMLISSEHFHSRLRKPELIDQLKKFLEQFFDEIKVVCYFREQSSMSRSLYSTLIKGSSTLNIQDFRKNMLNDYYYNFYEIANRWSSVFGRSSCEFKIFDKKYFPSGDLRRDFLDCLYRPIAFDSLNNRITQSNESLSYFQLELFRTINNAIPLFNKEIGSINEKNVLLKSIVTKCDGLNIKSLSKRDRAEDSKIYNEFQEINRLFFDKFFEGKVLFENRSELLYRDDHYTREQVANIICNLLSAIVEEKS